MSHEHLIAECEKSAQDAGAMEEEGCKEHREQAAKQQRDRDAHERIKKYHHQAMARIQLVIDALNSPL